MSGTGNMGNIRPGMMVHGSDNQMLGTVEQLHGDGIHVNGQHIPGSAIARVAQNIVYLRGTGAEYMGTTSGAGQMRSGTTSTEGEIRVPVAEERLGVTKQQVELGAVEIRKEVTQEQVSVPVDLMREEVHVQQRDIADRPAQAGDDLFQEGTIRIPVRGEEAVVTKEAVVTGEVVIDKERLVEQQTVTDTVRKERVEVNENYQRARGEFQQHFTQRQGTMGTGRTFEQAEPNYRQGFEAAHDERYAGRSFDEVEPEFRQSYESSRTTGGTTSGAGTSTSGGGDGWEHLREEIRTGYNRARGQ